MSDRTTDADLARVANQLTSYARAMGLIGPLERFTVDGAYGGKRLDVTGDMHLLEVKHGDRANWPEGWSGHRTGVLGVLPHYDTKRATYNSAAAVVRVLQDVRYAAQQGELTVLGQLLP